MALSIAIVDNEDGTALVTIDGSLGASVDIRRGTYGVDGQVTGVTTVATVTGDGDNEISGVGYWSWYAYVNVGTFTEEVFQPVTVGGDSIYRRCLDMLKDRIDSLNLTGWTVYVCKTGEDQQANLDFPCVLLTVADQAEEIDPVNNMQDDIGYAISLTHLDRVPAADNGNLPNWLRVRAQIVRAINQKRWDQRVPTVWKCEVRPAQVVASAATTGLPELTQGGMTIVCRSREYRNLAA